MNSLLRQTIHGALGGATGAACMTVFRMLARRAGLIDDMVPQAVETWLKRRDILPLPSLPRQRAAHHLVDQLLHLGYGASLGALYGVTLGRKRASAIRAASFGVGSWFVGSFVLLPAFRVMRPEWRAKPAEVLVNLSAHLVYAAALALLDDEFEQQSVFQPVQFALALSPKTG